MFIHCFCWIICFSLVRWERKGQGQREGKGEAGRASLLQMWRAWSCGPSNLYNSARKLVPTFWGLNLVQGTLWDICPGPSRPSQWQDRTHHPQGKATPNCGVLGEGTSWATKKETYSGTAQYGACELGISLWPQMAFQKLLRISQTLPKNEIGKI